VRLFALLTPWLIGGLVGDHTEILGDSRRLGNIWMNTHGRRESRRVFRNGNPLGPLNWIRQGSQSSQEGHRV
jgi:hypothetical protein